MSQRIGVMDLGTNTFHLLIAEIDGGSFRIVHRDRKPVKLGKGGINQRTIRPDAIERAVACMKDFRIRLNEEKVARFRALGTSALRDAANGKEVITAIRKHSGIEVEVISGQQEAEYIYYGVRSAVPLGDAPCLIVDIGGGSVEFIIADQSTIHWKTSLDIGAQRLLEQFHRHDPITPDEVAALDQHYAAALSLLEGPMNQWRPRVLVGSSGTFDTLSEIHCAAAGIPYPVQQTETPLTVDSCRAIHQKLISKNRAERMQIPGMIEMRVDMIVVASCLINYLLNRYNFSDVRVSTYSLKEGVLVALQA